MRRIDKGAWGNWITDGWPMEQVTVSEHDKTILRDLAKQFRELCERPIEQEKIKLWTAHNDLQETRPLILVDMENGWNEATSSARASWPATGRCGSARKSCTVQRSRMTNR